MPAVSRADFFGVGLFILCLCVLQNYVTLLEFDRQQILAGQVWRLCTGHFVHSHLLHLMLNGLTAAALYLIFIARIRAVELLCCALLFACLISLALLYQSPGLAWYNGLSGVLHALVAYCCIRCAYTDSKLYWFGFLAVWIKVLIELLRAKNGYLGELAGMTIIIQAHWLGVCVGTFSAFTYVTVTRVIDKANKLAL